MTKVYVMNSYIEKMASPDQDFRYMALSDITNAIKQDPSSFVGDEGVENRVLQNVLLLIEDKISEVKNQAVKCLGQITKVIREAQMDILMERLIDLSSNKDEETRDIAALALKTITAELPLEGKIAQKTCLKLTPKLLTQVADPSARQESLIEVLSILSILITRFPAYLSDPNIQPAPVGAITPLLGHSRPAVRKQAILTLAQFLPTSTPEQFQSLLRQSIIPGLASSHLESKRTVVQLVAAIARYAPQKIAADLGDVVPGVLKATNQDDAELRESGLRAVETIVLRCPSEITPFLKDIVALGVGLIKYDPNYAGDDDDEDAEMDDADDDDEELEGYSDDEDTSYKIRRSSAKLLAAVIDTRPELLATLYRDVSPALISRFGDREESVKLEVWATYRVLLSQTALYGDVSSLHTRAKSPGVGKRKRNEDEEGMEVEGSPIRLLEGQVPSLAKALFGQLKGPKTSSAVIQSGFELLISLLHVLPGSLSGQTQTLFATCKTVLAGSVTTTTAPLHAIVLSFLSLFFSTHSPVIFTGQLSSIIPSLLSSLREKHPRVVAESFRIFSALLNALRPVKSEAWLGDVHQEVITRLKSNDTDSEIRERAEECVGDLWICANEVMKTTGGNEWDYILRSTTRTETPIRVITKVAKEAEMDSRWFDASIEWVSGVLKKQGRVGKVEAFGCLFALLQKQSTTNPYTPTPALLQLLHQYLTVSDISLFSQAISIVSLLLQTSPRATYPSVEKDLLKDIYDLTYSPLISGASLDSLLTFYTSLVTADGPIATRLISNLIGSFNSAPKEKGSAAPSNVAKSIERVLRVEISMIAGTIAEFSKSLRGTSTDASKTLSLLVLGEIGRTVDMANQTSVFETAVQYFDAEAEEVRSAAAFAVGNMAIGNVQKYLPIIVTMVQTDDRRLLALQALKEVVSRCSNAQLEGVAETLWEPLFQTSGVTDEATNNAAAASIGKLTTTNPSRYLPQLQIRLRDPSPAIRGTVISAIRYTFADTSPAYDDQLSLVLPEFLALITDPDLSVRRLALAALNSAARNKPNLIRNHLHSILPHLYKETVLKPNLIKIVQMGPWQHKVDEGLEGRKTAYETMYTLLDTSLAKIDIHEYLGHVLDGLKDDADEVKVICHMMLFRLAEIAPTAVSQRLDQAAPSLQKTMEGMAVNKDTVKLDLERAAELQRSALRAIAALSKIATPGIAPQFDSLIERIQMGPHAPEFKELTSA
ncbi:ARM repeat-containing protein [Sistotremastrum suecicum HHB10207 ss-3]|uniref:ARM repeat-containing protein n=1 Tax=Sistotremastrum suecicum HHB10207 ss-3 TaxID=1314776 RepID=A0A166HM65_9AGAM|nr:ARM repeat-containing protein [Sistotremastrum suecicum HHB10207 ss-3]